MLEKKPKETTEQNSSDEYTSASQGDIAKHKGNRKKIILSALSIVLIATLGISLYIYNLSNRDTSDDSLTDEFSGLSEQIDSLDGGEGSYDDVSSIEVPEHLSSEQKATLYYQRALAANRSGDQDSALREAEQSYQYNQTFEAALLIANISEQNEDYETALNYYQNIINIYEEDPNLYDTEDYIENKIIEIKDRLEN